MGWMKGESERRRKVGRVEEDWTRTKGWMEGGKKIRRSGRGRKEGQRNRRERSSKVRGRGGRKEGTMKVVRELI